MKAILVVTLLIGALQFFGMGCEGPRQLIENPASSRGRLPESERAPLSFSMTFDGSLEPGPFSGWVYVMLSRDPSQEPRLSKGWVNPPPIFSRKVSNWRAGEELVMEPENCRFFPVHMASIEPDRYGVQAVLRRNLDSPVAGSGEGNLVSATLDVQLDPSTSGTIKLHLDQLVAASSFKESERIREVKIVSQRLSDFHGRPFTLSAGVRLPESWSKEKAEARGFPVVYSVTGFGGSHQGVGRLARRFGAPELTDQVLLVIPDARCYRGHSVFADSETNGPWGAALVHELIPHIEKLYGGAGPEHRYVTGVSSGGWSSLWLQVTYPEVFNGCWSIVPDPVDFRDFQRIDLYDEDANMYRTQEGDRRPLMRRGDQVLIHYDDFVSMEEARGPGGQIHSFEAVFSPLGENGEPRPLFDRATGNVDPTVARAWKKYDIRLFLERNWETLEPKLAGKIRVQAGAVDTFYLEGAVALLKDSMEKLGSDAQIWVEPGISHRPAPGIMKSMMTTVIEAFEKSGR